MKRVRAVASVLAMLGALVLGPGVGSASAAGIPLTGYGTSTGAGICDTVNEINPAHADVACASGYSAFVGSDGSTLAFGLVTEVDPRTSQNGGPLDSTAYVVAIAVNGVQVATVGVDGKQVNDTDYIYAKCFGNAALTYNKLVTTATGDGSFVVTPMTGTSYFRVDFTIPLSALSGCGLTTTTPVQLYYGSSQAANLDVINKDLFRDGDAAVTFGGLATVTFGGSLTLAKAATHVSGPNPPGPGQTSTYDLAVAVSNPSVYPLTGVQVVDDLPAGVQLVSRSATTGSIVVTGQHVVWSGFDLAAGLGATLTMRVSITPGAAAVGSAFLLNAGATGSATRGDGVAVTASSNSVSTGVVNGPVLSLTKTASPTFVAAGGAVAYTLTVANSGTAAATLTSLVDTLPSGFGFVVGSTGGTLGAGAPTVSGSTVTWSGPFALAAGASRTLTFSATASATPGTYPNNASVAASNGAPASTGPTATVTVNSPPTAQPDSASTPRGVAVSVDVRANDTDPDPGTTLTVTGVTAPSAGTAVIDATTGRVVYTPPAGFSGVATFGYTISDGFGGTSSSTVSVTVVNAGPTANGDSLTAAPGSTDTVGVLGNDTDPDGDSLSVTAVSPAGHGATALTAGGAVTYTASTSYVGADSFTYTVSDGHGGTATATVSVTVPNTAPTAVDDSAATLVDQPVTVSVLSNDTDPNAGQTLAVTGATVPAHGTAVVNANGTITYTPTAGYLGPDGFDYTLTDGTATDIGHVSLTVSAGAPVAVDDSATTGTNTDVTIAVLTNDVAFLPLSVAAGSITAPVVVPPVGPPSGVSAGSAVLNPDGTITFTPATGFTGTAAFTYRATDGASTSASPATVTVTVLNAAPVAVADSVPNATRAAAQPIDVLANDTDANNDPLTITGVSGVSSGASVSIDVGGGPAGRDRVLYTPPAGFTGTDTFMYAVADGRGGSSSALVTVTIADNAPVAVDDTAGPTLGPTPVAVLANDSDPDGDALTVTGATTPAAGTAVVNADNTITYTPNAGFLGTDGFDYTISDGHGQTDTGHVSVTVPDTAPVANADSATTVVGQPVTVTVLGNDTDANPLQTLAVTSASTPAHGSAVVNGDGTITYTPAGTYRGPDSFTYTISDGAGGTDSAQVDITVDDRAPIAVDDTTGTPRNTPATVPVLGNDTDPDGDALAVVPGSITTPVIVVPVGPPGVPAGSTVLNPNGTITYTPPAGFTGTVSFSYDVTDGELTDSALVTVTVSNAAPVAVDDNASTTEGSDVTVTVLGNDTDADADSLAVVAGSVTSPVASPGGTPAGSAVLNPNGTVTFSPAAGFSGTATFGYDVTDGIDTDSAVVTVTVDAVVPPTPSPSPASPSPSPASPSPSPASPSPSPASPSPSPASPSPSPASPSPSPASPASPSPSPASQSPSPASPSPSPASPSPSPASPSPSPASPSPSPASPSPSPASPTPSVAGAAAGPVSVVVAPSPGAVVIDPAPPAIAPAASAVPAVKPVASATPSATPAPLPDTGGAGSVSLTPTRPLLPRTGAPLALMLVTGLGSLLIGFGVRYAGRRPADLTH